MSTHVSKTYSDAENQSIALAEEISKRLVSAVASKGAATLVVSGGRSPIRLFQLLSQQNVPWSFVTITLVDERWVPITDDASNERLVRENLMVGNAAAAQFLSIKNLAATPEEGTVACNAALSQLTLPFDVIVLGMGDDGHTASLFPNGQGLKNALETDSLCAAVRPKTAPHPRMTLTLRALQESHWIVLPLQGEAKLRTYRTALEAGPIDDMPVRALLRQTSTPIEVWITN